MTQHLVNRESLRRLLAFLPGLMLAIILVGWLVHGLQLRRVGDLLAHAQWRYVALIAVTVWLEFWLRAWKWSQVLSPLRRIPTHFVFRAYMAGFVPGLTIGFGSSVLTRAWLVARRASLTTSTVLGSLAVDRLIDGFVFIGFVAFAAFATPANAPVGLVLGVRWGAGLLLALALIVLGVLIRQRRRPLAAQWLPKIVKPYWDRLAISFAQGLEWPVEPRRRTAIVIVSVAVRLVSAVQMVWAGAAIGVWLAPIDYILIMVVLGAWIVIGLFVRVPGSGVVVVALVLQLFGLTAEQALALTLLDTGVFVVAVVIIGAVVLWHEGIRASWLRQLQDIEPRQI